MLFDEPTSALDPELVAEVIDNPRHERARRFLRLVEHDAAAIAAEE